MKKHIIDEQINLKQALGYMNQQRVKFLVVVDKEGHVSGTLTDGDIRRAILRGVTLQEPVSSVMCRDYTSVPMSAELTHILDEFQDPSIEFLPVKDNDGKLCNIITRRGLHVLLLKNQKFQVDFDFSTIDENEMEYAIFARPWGFYKTTVLNNLFQSKVVSIMPGQALSLQSHQRREEYWIIVSGAGMMQLGESIHPVSPGGSYFIPKGCQHRLINTSETETLILTEVQLGDYFGEDDITRYDDRYGR